MSFSFDYDDFMNEGYDAYEAELDDIDGWYQAMVAMGDFPADQQGGAVDPLLNRVNIADDGYFRSAKYACQFRRFKVTVQDLEDISPTEIHTYIHRLLQKLIVDVGATAADHHLVRICLDSRSMNNAIWTPPISKSQLTVDRWMAEVTRVLNSNEQVRLDQDFSVLVQIYEVPAGACDHDVPDLVKEKLNKFGFIVQVKNTKDKACLARCFVIAEALVKHGRSSQHYRDMVKNGGMQRHAALELLTRLGLPDREMTLEDLPKFATAFPNFRIRDYGLEQNKAIIWDNKRETDQVINTIPITLPS